MKLRSKAALFALVAGIWPYLRNIVCTHNPVFPFLSPALSPALVMAYAVKALASNTGGSSIPGQRNCLFVLGAFGAIGLVLVIMGVFSVMAYTVSLRTHEIGIRMALGAVERDVLRMVLKSGLVLVTAGALAGVNMSLALTRLMASQIWGVSATDPWTFSVVVLVLFVAGLAACLLPARRATQVNPLIALRSE